MIDQSQLDAMRPWLHDFDLPAPLRVPMDASLRARIVQRRNLIVPRIVAQFPGGRLDGLRVLDLGANAGFWARQMAALGANVTAIEPKRHNVAQAEAVAQVLGDAGIIWIEDTAEAFLSESTQRFDVVLNLGLLYHAEDAYGLLRLSAGACSDLLVVDSHCINDDAAYIEYRLEYTELPSQGTSPVVTVPSRGGIYQMMRATGFDQLMESANSGDVPADYASFTRVCMFARRHGRLMQASPADMLEDQLKRVYPSLPAQGDLNRSAPAPRTNLRRDVEGAAKT